MIETVEDLLKSIISSGLESIRESENINHNPLVGEMYEGLTQKVLQKSLFKNFNLYVSSGKIQNSNGSLSRQIDCMLTVGKGELLPFTNKYIHDIKNVIAVIEVKKTLNPKEIKSSFENLYSVTELELSDDRDRSKSLYKPNMLDDALRVIAKKRHFRATGEDKTLDFIHNSVMLDTALPIRIIYSYYGYKTERGLRKAFLRQLSKSKINSLSLPALSPSLVICGDISIVKYNGMPFASTYGSEGDKWCFYNSQKGNSVFNFLNIIWYRICKKFSVPFEFQVDGRIYSYHNLISTQIPSLIKSKFPVYEYIKYPKNIIEEKAQLVPWEPKKVSPSTFEVFKYLSQNYELTISDKEKFIIGLKERLQAYKKFVSITSPEKLDHFTDEVLEYDRIIDNLIKTGLVGIKDGKLELLTSRGMMVHINKGMFVGENRDGRLQSWLIGKL